jgi:hypothetical protein
MDPVVFARNPGLDAIRLRRAELFESMAALEQALAEPASGRLAEWTEWVNVALVALSADIRAHLAITEGAGGLHGDVIVTAPRLTRAVERLVAEHVVINDMVCELETQARAVTTLDQVDRLRDLGHALMARLSKHRQRGADLVFEAYQTDIGGET